MRKLKLILALIFSVLTVTAQDKHAFTLEKAKDYAKEHSYILLNSKADIESAKKKVWETTAIGLPQVSASGSYNYMFSLPEVTKQFAGLGDLIAKLSGKPVTPGAKVSESDMKWSSTIDVKVTQLLFSGSYIVGLQSAKAYKLLSKLIHTKNVDDVIESVENAYITVLIAEENTIILENTCDNLRKILKETEEIHKEGFIEDIDVDQLELTVSKIENSLSMLKRQVDLAYRLLKFQMGIKENIEIVLEEKLDNLILSSNLKLMANLNFDVNTNISYKLAENQTELSHLSLKLTKTNFLPTIAAFYNHNENLNDKSFNMNPADVVGVQVNLPIFSSGKRISQIGQARIEYRKAKTNMLKASEGLLLQYEQSKTNYYTSLDTYKNNKKNLKISKRIYDKTTIKYKEGVSSSLDLTQTQNQYLQAQSDYYSSVLNLFRNKNQLSKLLKKY